MARVILVGGPTFIGKSKLIDLIIEKDSKFVRPRSYTTRSRRHDETRIEYEHISVDEFHRLKANGLFVTVDEVYGNYYSIAYDSIAEVVKNEKIAIKEVHPKNHAKIKGLLQEVISVLLLPQDPEKFWLDAERNAAGLPQDRLARLRDDREFYETIDSSSYPFDIVLMVDASSKLESLKDEFLIKLNTLTGEAIENTKTIEKRNRAGYDFIADEFTDEKRITTANFHDLSQSFFESEAAHYAQMDKLVIDLGTGRGHLSHLLLQVFTSVVAVDLSYRMLSLIESPSNRLIKICSSAFALPFANESLSLIISSLADPFLRREALSEILRTLKKDGVFLFSSLSRIWSDAIRSIGDSSQAVTRFVHSSGAEAAVYSFTYTDDELRQLLVSCGFQIQTFQTTCGRELRGYNRTISSAIADAARKLQVDIDDLPILQLVTAQKVS